MGLTNIRLGNIGAFVRTEEDQASHPKLLTYVAYAKDPPKLSPSQVLKVNIQEDGSHVTDEIYLDRGEALSGSSVAAVFKDRLLIGSVLDDRFLLCNLGK